MSDDFSIDCSVDDAKKLLRIVTYGTIDSAAFADRCIAFFGDIDEPWLYGRLYDETRSTGVVAYEDLQRMARVLNPLWSRARTPPRVAVANPSKLVAARMPMVSHMNAHPNHRVFATAEEAEAWLLA